MRCVAWEIRNEQYRAENGRYEGEVGWMNELWGVMEDNCERAEALCHYGGEDLKSNVKG